MLERKPPVIEYLFQVNDELNKIEMQKKKEALQNMSSSNNNNSGTSTSQLEVIKVVKDEWMDEQFINYIKANNVE